MNDVGATYHKFLEHEVFQPEICIFAQEENF